LPGFQEIPGAGIAKATYDKCLTYLNAMTQDTVPQILFRTHAEMDTGQAVDRNGYGTILSYNSISFDGSGKIISDQANNAAFGGQPVTVTYIGYDALDLGITQSGAKSVFTNSPRGDHLIVWPMQSDRYQALSLDKTWLRRAFLKACPFIPTPDATNYQMIVDGTSVMSPLVTSLPTFQLPGLYTGAGESWDSVGATLTRTIKGFDGFAGTTYPKLTDYKTIGSLPISIVC
jgi:hypothetical protein